MKRLSFRHACRKRMDAELATTLTSLCHSSSRPLQGNAIVHERHSAVKDGGRVFVRLCACGRSFGRKAESRNAAAGGRGRHCGISAAVGESEDQRKPERFSGHRKAAETPGGRPTSVSCNCAEVQLFPRLYVSPPRFVLLPFLLTRRVIWL